MSVKSVYYISAYIQYFNKSRPGKVHCHESYCHYEGMNNDKFYQMNLVYKWICHLILMIKINRMSMDATKLRTFINEIKVTKIS